MILMQTLNQVARDHQLLNTARDYFHFATTFLELIESSATHVYHSALELSPLSSIVRKCYCHQRLHPLPRVVTGILDSWNPSTTVSTKHTYYLSSTWSPCGQFVAAVAEEVVEIRDALTLELLSTLQSIKVATRLRRGLAYSPDGCFMAGCSDTAIVIWDIQTGGEVNKIDCEVTSDGLEFVWSLDGKTIGTVSPRVLGTITVHTYDVASGAVLLSSTVQSIGGVYLWAHDKSFQIATTAWGHKCWTINIFEVGSGLTKIKSFPFQLNSPPGVFSPTTYRISISTAGDHKHGPELLILDVCNSEVLLQETGSYWRLSFSPDGSLFAAFSRDYLYIWKCISGHYTRWREFHQAPTELQFSPTSSSILGHASTLLHVLHLDYSPAALTTKSVTPAHGRPRDAYPSHGTYIATTHSGESTITITNLHSQNPTPCQFIDIDFEILEIVLTGNVLLVKGSERIVAWLLTEEGPVDGIFGNTRADHSDSLWEVSTRAFITGWARLLGQGGSDSDNDAYLDFVVEDKVAAIRHSGCVIRVYHTGTGEILKSDKAPLNTGYHFHNPHQDECNLYHHSLYKHHEPLKNDWPVSQTTLQEGWVKDPEGKHWLWLYPHWRSGWNDVDWFNKATTLRLKNSSELIIIKF